MHRLVTIIAALPLVAAGCAEDSVRQTAPTTASKTAEAPQLSEPTPAPVEVAGPAQSPATPAPSPAGADTGDLTCPVQGRAFQVMTNDIDGGIALELASDNLPPDQLEDLASHLGESSREVITQPMTGPIRGTRAEHAMRRMPAAKVEVERTGERVWMTIVAEDAEDTDRVRELGREAADAIRRGDCPLHGHG
jgi:hypothetical protein